MIEILVIVHIIVCFLLVVVILLQSGHEGMGVIFGGSSSTLFGSSGAGSFLIKLTIGLSTVFFITSLSFTYIKAEKKKTPETSIFLQKKPPAKSNPLKPKNNPK